MKALEVQTGSETQNLFEVGAQIVENAVEMSFHDIINHKTHVSWIFRYLVGF